MTTLKGDYEPSTWDWVRDQVAEYEASGGQRANTLMDTGLPIIVVSTRGAKSGKVRKNPLMRVEHDGEYALVASKGGMPENPEWYHNLVAHPDEVVIQDGPEPFAVTVREVTGDEKAQWWERAVAAYPPYAEYQQNTNAPDPSVHRHARRLEEGAAAGAHRPEGLSVGAGVRVRPTRVGQAPARAKASTTAARHGGSSSSRS